MKFKKLKEYMASQGIYTQADYAQKKGFSRQYLNKLISEGEVDTWFGHGRTWVNEAGDAPPGYHTRPIQKGVLGELSKISEEYEELMDASKQNSPVMEICELCDLIGAIEAYAARHHFTLQDLIRMKESTQRAFQNGSRK